MGYCVEDIQYLQALNIDRAEAHMAYENIFRNFEFGYTLTVFYGATFVFDGSPLNLSIAAVTGWSNCDWRGPVLVTRSRESLDSNPEEVYYDDMDLADLRHGLDIICSLNNYGHHHSGRMVKGVRVSSAEAQKVMTYPEPNRLIFRGTSRR